jgi:RNA polymerase sigma factor (sigma-70 family)
MHEDFRVLFDHHAARIVRLAFLLGADDPEDLAQEAFVRLYERRQRLSTVEDIGAYLNRTVVNLARDRHRRVVSRRKAAVLLHREGQRQTPSAEETSLQGLDRHRVLDALELLAPRRREAVVLRYWLDLPYSAIAAVMGTSLGAAKSAVSRGLDDLHAHLEES